MIALLGPIGALADKIGRRPIYVAGFCLIATGYVLYPTATSLPMLYGFRFIYASGAACIVAMLATVQADYPQNATRGKNDRRLRLSSGIGSRRLDIHPHAPARVLLVCHRCIGHLGRSLCAVDCGRHLPLRCRRSAPRSQRRCPPHRLAKGKTFQPFKNRNSRGPESSDRLVVWGGHDFPRRFGFWSAHSLPYGSRKPASRPG